MLLFSLIICSCLFNMTVYNKLKTLKNICIFSLKNKKIYQVLLYAMNITKETVKLNTVQFYNVE